MRREAVLYFDGPLSRWKGEPDEREVIQRKLFRFEAVAQGWAKGRLRGLVNCRYVVRAHDTV